MRASPSWAQKHHKRMISLGSRFVVLSHLATKQRLTRRDFKRKTRTFDIYVVDMYKWLLIPPDPLKIEDVHYQNEKLEEIMSGYKRKSG
jgi:hypothetical protein